MKKVFAWIAANILAEQVDIFALIKRALSECWLSPNLSRGKLGLVLIDLQNSTQIQFSHNILLIQGGKDGAELFIKVPLLKLSVFESG
jgi:hypothetical protein